jgi:hypothetical protein
VRFFHSKLDLENGVDDAIHTFYIDETHHGPGSSPHSIKQRSITLVERSLRHRYRGKAKKDNEVSLLIRETFLREIWLVIQQETKRESDQEQDWKQPEVPLFVSCLGSPARSHCCLFPSRR